MLQQQETTKDLVDALVDSKSANYFSLLEAVTPRPGITTSSSAYLRLHVFVVLDLTFLKLLH